jgi:hypothetical protein
MRKRVRLFLFPKMVLLKMLTLLAVAPEFYLFGQDQAIETRI